MFKKIDHFFCYLIALNIGHNHFFQHGNYFKKVSSKSCNRIDTEIIVFLPKNSKGFVTSVFRGDEISEFNGEHQRLWVEILNKSYEETIEI